MIDALLIEACRLVAPRLDASVYEGKSSLQAMKIALAACDPHLRVDSKDEVYINARFRGEVANARRDVAAGRRPSPPGFRSDSSDTFRHDFGGSLSLVSDRGDDDGFRSPSMLAQFQADLAHLRAQLAGDEETKTDGGDDDPFDISAKHLMPFTEERDDALDSDDDEFDLGAQLAGACTRPFSVDDEEN